MTCRRLIARFAPGLRAQLVIAFVLVVADALALVVATPAASTQRVLRSSNRPPTSNRRTDAVAQFMVGRASRISALWRQRRPADPCADHATPRLRRAASRNRDSTDGGRVADLATNVAQANIRVRIAADPAQPEQVAYELNIPLPDTRAAGSATGSDHIGPRFRPIRRSPTASGRRLTEAHRSAS